jgi:hypothetical protein
MEAKVRSCQRGAVGGCSTPPDEFLPLWLPTQLRETACELHHEAGRSGSEDVDLVVRVVTDSRMENVWRELSKKNKNPKRVQMDGTPKAFVHQPFIPAWLFAAVPNAAERDLWVGIDLFLRGIVDFALMSKPIAFRAGDRAANLKRAEVILEAAAERMRAHTPAEIERMQARFEDWESDPIDLRGTELTREAFKVAAAASIFRRAAYATEPDEIKRNKSVVEGFVFYTAWKANTLFLSTMPGQVATIATVVFGREIKEGFVRGICYRYGLKDGGRIVARRPQDARD